jgi:predicted oxidoreductase
MNKESTSSIISGTMLWGKWGVSLSTAKMQELIEYNIEIGINSFDHADIYGGYTTEAEFGKALQFSNTQRENIKLISKCGIQYPSELRPHKVKHYDYSQKHIRNSVENTLRNLKTEYIDIFLLHRPSPLMNPIKIGEIISDLINEGKIKKFGVSNFTKDQIELLNTSTNVMYNQLECSLTHCNSMNNGTLDYCQSKNIDIMAWSPLGSYFKIFDEKRTRINSIFKKLSKNYSCSEDQLLLAWLFKHPAGINPIVGTTKKERLLSSTKAKFININTSDWFEILEASLGESVP